MTVALLLRHLGVSSLAVTELNPLRHKTIERHIGCQVIDSRTQPIPEADFDYIIDAVGAKLTRAQSFAAVKPGGVIMHVGLQDLASEIDMRKLTLAEIALLGTYTYTTADLRATVGALHRGVFGDLAWVEERPLEDGAQAFIDLDKGHSAAAKIVLLP